MQLSSQPLFVRAGRATDYFAKLTGSIDHPAQPVGHGQQKQANARNQDYRTDRNLDSRDKVMQSHLAASVRLPRGNA